MPVGEVADIHGLDCGWQSRAYTGMRVCGDGVYVQDTTTHLRVAVFDGLGHGPRAATFPEAASRYLACNWKDNPKANLLALDQAVQTTAGGAAAIALVDKADFTVRLGVVGNIGVYTDNAERGRHLAGPEGYVGSGQIRVVSQFFELGNGDVLVIYSDGLSDKFTLQPSSRLQSALTLARGLVQEEGKDYDDATCLVIKRRRDGR
ncbi:MAG: SpoIIE family protein phosphatase [Gammaproteobacteria bacterium]